MQRDPDEIEAAFRAGAAAALDKKAKALRDKAAAGITAAEYHGKRVRVVTSEARAILTLAEDFEAIAADLGGGS
jgi:hypothetical protein